MSQEARGLDPKDWVVPPDQADEGKRELSVERANGPDVGFHFRLLARLEGQVGERNLFTGPDRATV